ncbi:MAG: phenylalanyl-tRNA synthetase alpha chain [Patescibacteria group bacterium]|nr:phenylalanyl-tRNA synthetase alpha chain [Patescibacteria group bacterium]
MKQKLMTIKNHAVSLILDTKDAKELEQIKLQFLGKSGSLTQLMKEITTLAPEERKEIGVLINETKTILEEAITTALTKHTTVKKENLAQFDVTEPGKRPSLGHIHPVTQAIEEITSIFEKIGFSRVRHPEIEWDWYAFGALNFPDNHPARDDWETFFIKQEKDPKKGSVLLTPHTSSGQIREMEKGKFPIQMLNIAKTYRRQSDASHVPMFHQFETLFIGENISITHLKGVLDYFVKSYFGQDRVSRIRPYHFQFTEPSFETDVSCGVCKGKGCRLCKEGWLELGGAGMVHPNVLKNCGIDPTKYSGFASGWGVERVLAMKEGVNIDDVRLFYANRMEFLEQF